MGLERVREILDIARLGLEVVGATRGCIGHLGLGGGVEVLERLGESIGPGLARRGNAGHAALLEGPELLDGRARHGFLESGLERFHFFPFLWSIILFWRVKSSGDMHASPLARIARTASKSTRLAKLALAIPAYPLVPARARPAYTTWLRAEVEMAGCLFVKIGQWVSTRTDIFPEGLTEEFAALRDSSRPMNLDEAYRALGPLTFDSFDPTPISTGSIAQVHRAIWKGRDVAVKVQRPRLLEDLRADVDILKSLLGGVRFANFKTYTDLVASLDDLIATVTRELDFEAEAGHMRRFRAFFQDGGKVVVPEVFAVTSTAIVMEFVDAAPFRQPPVVLMEAFFRQFFELGWLHTDMHSGNLGETPDGKLVLFDFGSVLECPDDIRLCIKHLIVSYLNRDVSIMLDYMLEYGILVGTPDADERLMLESFIANVLEYVELTDIGKFARVMKTIPVPISSQTSFRPEIFMIMRTFTLLEGLCKTIDPDFVILDAVSPLTAAFASDPMVIRLKIEDDLRTVFRMASFVSRDENVPPRS